MLRKLSNFSASDKSLYGVFSGEAACCSDAPKACAYTLTIPTAATVNSVKIKHTATGEEVTLNIGASGSSTVRAAIKQALASVGYREDGDVPNGVTFTTSGSNTIYKVVGTLIVVSATHSGSTVVNAVQKCTRVGICNFTWEGTTSDTANTFVVNGVSASLGALPFSSTTAAALQSAITGAANYPAGYTTTVTKGASTFTIVINGPAPIVFALNGVSFSQGNCVTDYI